MPDLGFKLMTLIFGVRNIVRPRKNVLEEAGIEPGFQVLDYGCGPGGYIRPLADLVGSEGKIYALDIHPLAISRVQKIAKRSGIKNVETIQSDCQTGLPDGHLDLVLLYDVFHDLSNGSDVLQELHRVLKHGGRLSFSDHHMEESDILEKLAALGMFKLENKGKITYTFKKAG